MMKEKIIRHLLLLTVVMFFSSIINATVKLPALFSDHMVLQQKARVPLWGWGSPSEEISIEASWQKDKVQTKVDASGNWKVEVETPQAGGPYKIKINGENSIELND